MNERTWLAPGLLIAAVGLPWLILQGGGDQSASGGVRAKIASPLPTQGEMDPTWPALEFLPVMDLGEIFRFDISPQWVAERWQPVSKTSDAAGWTLMRVPLVTGTNPWDLHGSLTYSFDATGILKRIGFVGWTGDPSMLEGVLTERFRFSRVSSQQLQVLAARSLGALTGVALFRPTDAPRPTANQKVAIWLEINDPRFGGRASQEAMAWFQAAKSKPR